MIIITEPGATEPQIDGIREQVESLSLRTHLTWKGDKALIACLGDFGPEDLSRVGAIPGVGAIVPWPKPYRLASRELGLYSHGRTLVRIGDGPEAIVGGRMLLVAAGPCAVEGAAMLAETARGVWRAGASALRGGAFKPRTSPYAFQGLGLEALKLLAEARRWTGLPVITEVMDTRDVEVVAAHADVLQVGARSMQHYPLLRELGRIRRPVLLKRGPSATITELLLAAEHILAHGNPDVILCERGIRTFDSATRNTLDIGAIPVLHRETHLPVLVDPSHAAGRAELVAPLAFAAVAAGADGLLVEVHPDPERAWSDGDQSLTLDAFRGLMAGLRTLAAAIGRAVPQPRETATTEAAA